MYYFFATDLFDFYMWAISYFIWFLFFLFFVASIKTNKVVEVLREHRVHSNSCTVRIIQSALCMDVYHDYFWARRHGICSQELRLIKKGKTWFLKNKVEIRLLPHLSAVSINSHCLRLGVVVVVVGVLGFPNGARDTVVSTVEKERHTTQQFIKFLSDARARVCVCLCVCTRAQKKRNPSLALALGYSCNQ
jgi:hypothetical protein